MQLSVEKMCVRLSPAGEGGGEGEPLKQSATSQNQDAPAANPQPLLAKCRLGRYLFPVSKQRPSKTTSRRAAPSAARAKATFHAAYWRRRLFKNTFTRNGERTVLKPWSVKIQHQGQRRTFSLAAANRASAAREAWRIYQRIVASGEKRAVNRSRGLNSIPAPPTSGTAARSALASEPAVWQPRLLHRKYLDFLNDGTTEELSVQIEHAGVSYCFRLGTSEADRAVAQAVEIHRAVVNEGWDAACERFRRELTVAFRWSDNPVAWTYTTLHTQAAAPDDSAGSKPSNQTARSSVAVVESDAGIRRALAGIIDRQNGWRASAAFAGVAETLRELPRRRAELVVINHSLANQPGGEWLAQLQAVAPKTACLQYSVYADSDQLFASVPGGCNGYFLKRLPPHQILDPVAGTPGTRNCSGAELTGAARQYFRRLLLPLPGPDRAQEISKLTQREQQVLSLLSQGYIDKSIADALKISIWTVHGHVKNIFEKLNVHTRTGAVVKFLQK